MLALAVLCVSMSMLIGAGFWMIRNGHRLRSPRTVLTAAMLGAFLSLAFAATAALAAEAPEASSAAGGAMGLGLIGAALSTGLACVGAGIGVAFVGAAALGVVGERPELFGTTLIYMGLAEGIAIYGLVISLFILGKL